MHTHCTWAHICATLRGKAGESWKKAHMRGNHRPITMVRKNGDSCPALFAFHFHNNKNQREKETKKKRKNKEQANNKISEIESVCHREQGIRDICAMEQQLCVWETSKTWVWVYMGSFFQVNRGVSWKQRNNGMQLRKAGQEAGGNSVGNKQPPLKPRLYQHCNQSCSWHSHICLIISTNAPSTHIHQTRQTCTASSCGFSPPQ